MTISQKIRYNSIVGSRAGDNRENKVSNKLTVVYGGQWGSEGKGDVVAHLVQEHLQEGTHKLLAVRVGGPNAGHTIIDAKGVERKVQQIPCAAFLDRDAYIVIGASAVIDTHILSRELDWLRDTWGDLGIPTIYIDRHAILITPQMQYAENEMKTTIGSTGEGVGAATVSKVMRNLDDTIEQVAIRWEEGTGGQSLYFGDYDTVIELTDTVRAINQIIVQEDDFHVLIEGTQGYLLSLNTSGNFPFVTSRDCGPEAIMGQVGISPRAFRTDDVRIIAVFRTFPIRVGGNSGPLPYEISWDQLREETEGHVAQPEKTTVTKKNRRISRWDPVTVEQTIRETRPTEIALTFLDYVFPGDKEASTFLELSPSARAYLRATQEELGVPITIASAKPHGCFRAYRPDKQRKA